MKRLQLKCCSRFFFETPDFEYSIVIEQVPGIPGQAVVIRWIEWVYNSNLFDIVALNNLFNSHFDNIVFSLYADIDIADLIDKIEELDEESAISISYNPVELDSCVIKLNGLDFPIEVGKILFLYLIVIKPAHAICF
jgi:hypothetical protein